MSRCFPFPPPGYVKIGERGGEGSIEIESIKLQKERKKAEKERKREKKRERKERKELLKKQKDVCDGKTDKLEGKKPLQGDGKKMDSYSVNATVLSDNSSRSGLSEEHGQPIPENTFYLSDGTDSSKKRKRDDSTPCIERKGTKLRVCFTLKKPSASEVPVGREELTCSSSHVQKAPETHIGRQQPRSNLQAAVQPLHEKISHVRESSTLSYAKPIPERREVQPHLLQKPFPERREVRLVPVQKPVTERREVRPVPVQKPVTERREVKPVQVQKSVSERNGVKPLPLQLQNLCSSEVRDGREQPICSTSGAATQVQHEKSTDASPQELFAPRDVKPLSDRRDTKSSRRESSIESLYNSLVLDWVPPPLVVNEDSDEQEWLFETKRQRETVPGCSEAEAGNDILPDCKTNLWPRAHYLPAAEIYALPFTVPY